ncbi:hypothetical protein RSOLAG22IIIB_11486 [Rhizoctonia solani]|uniref:Uncharacterized protein n=1 Tax=Rhizoctonia solani TaxID=456999 RepID=A0A0K6G8V2_9AGAM|nr:hypothetical protein RSOLAG22IIIB_11486 [Rhizoctonia solani]
MKLPQDEPDDVEATPAPKPSRSKRPATRRVPNSKEEAGEGEPKPTKASGRPQKIARNQPIKGSENKINDANKQDRPPAPGSDSPPGDEESMTGISGNVREATPSDNPTGGKRKTNGYREGKPSGSDVMEETEQPAERSKKGRQEKQELIDEVNGVIGCTRIIICICNYISLASVFALFVFDDTIHSNFKFGLFSSLGRLYLSFSGSLPLVLELSH